MSVKPMPRGPYEAANPLEWLCTFQFAETITAGDLIPVWSMVHDVCTESWTLEGSCMRKATEAAWAHRCP